MSEAEKSVTSNSTDTRMTIQFNTDKTVKWDERHTEHFHALISEELKRYSTHITRIEVHLSDENGPKEGVNDIRCLLEARLEGRQPIAITAMADSEELAISAALGKLNASLKTTIGRMTEHEH